MWCMKCDKDLRDCMCSDRNARIRDISNHPNVAIKWCVTCDQSYHACKCAVPDFKMRTGGKIEPLPDGVL